MQLGIRTRVILLVLICALPLVLSAVDDAKRNERLALERAQQDALILSRSFSAGLNDVFDNARYLLSGFIAGSGDLDQALTGTGCEGRMRRLLATSPYHVNMVVADINGELVCAARPLSQSINVADRRYFRDALEKKAFALSDVIISRDSGAQVIVVAQPVLDSTKRVSWILLATFQLEALSQNIARAGAPRYLVTYLVNTEGQIVLRWPHVPELLGGTLKDLADAIKTGGATEGIAKVVGLDGETRVTAYSRLRDIGGGARYVAVGIPLTVVNQNPRAALNRDVLSIAGTMALAILLGLGGALFMVVKPVHALTRAAERYGHGDLNARSGIAHGSDEIGRLAATFDGLAEHNQRVTRAHKALSAGNQALLRERRESELLQAMCRVAVDQAGYVSAYVLFARENEARSVDVMAQYGADNGFITAVPLNWGDTTHPQVTVNRCIQSGERAVLRSIASDPRTAPLQEVAKKGGLRSMISLPLRLPNALIGTFTLVAAEENSFDDAEVALLDEMAADLSFGIEVIRSESRRKHAEEIARRALTHDHVVDLPNHAAFLSQVDEFIRRAQKEAAPVAVLDLHLARIQDVFDSFGYKHGNSVLRQVGERLKNVRGGEYAPARLPTDDFGMVLYGHDARTAASVAREALAAFNEPVAVGAALIDVQAWVGATFFPGHGDDAEALVRRASIAAREGYRREIKFQVYGGATARENQARLSLAADLRVAIENRALMLQYQPKVEFASGSHIGCEALIRWHHPKHGIVPPADFIPLAEEIGLVGQLTYHVIDIAVRQQHAWGAGGATPVAINLSARNLLDATLFTTLKDTFTTWGVSRELIHFEITESALIHDPEAARRAIRKLCDGGAKVYIDDFGTGYSSLSYLVRLPVHALKIDRSFIHHMGKSLEARSVIASIISMAHNLKMKVVAEGVETKSDFETLREMGCDEAQGNFIAKPLDAADYEAWRLRS